MALDPRHPVIGRALGRAQAALPAAGGGRAAAGGRGPQGGGGGAGGGARGVHAGPKLAAEADALFRRQDYAAAAQKYLESRDAFERAKRRGGEARAAARAPLPSALPTLPPALVDALAPRPHDRARAHRVADRRRRPAAGSRHRSLLPPSTPAPVPATPRSGGSEAEVQRVIAEYGRAMETRDLALYRTLKPGLSSEDEKRLREAFKAYKPQRVGITVDSVQVEGDRATVRATRQDVIDGRPTKAVSQTFRLVRVGATWRIQSIGQ